MQCDEQQPICGLCKRVKKKCSFAVSESRELVTTPKDNFVLPSNASPTIHQMDLSFRCRNDSRTPTPIDCMPQSNVGLPPSLSAPHTQPLPLADLELLYHQMRFYEVTGQDSSDIQVGFAFPYVLHSILSLSALLLFSEQPSRIELLDRACAHQNSALTLVRPHLVDLNKQNVNAVVKFSAITSVIALAQPLYQHPYRISRTSDPISDMLNSFHMTRGIRSVLERQWEMDGIHRDLDAGPELDDDDPWQQDLITKYPPYPILRNLITSHCTFEADKLVCLDATRKVFSFITLLEDHPNLHPDARLVQIWPIEIKKHFLNMLIARRPIALLVLGYYSVLMRLRSDTMWPFDTWSARLLQRIEEVLGDEWAEYLDWPRSRVLS
ncbi:hypothetical protein QM012_007855 [Aureobasidium pullulans]|uniref:Zn(2)-C6 fungal-type domain-containing protein n=1 Tax=Aureobasidium pullulans TaxID=5580 RepID=A0ABR0TME6_AURPU